MALFNIFNRKKKEQQLAQEAQQQVQTTQPTVEQQQTDNVIEQQHEAQPDDVRKDEPILQQPAAEQTVVEQSEPEKPVEEPKKKGFFRSFFSREKKETLDHGLEKTKQGVFAKIAHAVAGKSTIDDDVLDNLEEVFITSDVGVDTTLKIIDRIQKRVAKDKYVGTGELNDLLCDEITQMLADNNNVGMEDFTVPDDKKPYVIMVVGVNGVGKTTTIGKLAYLSSQATRSCSVLPTPIVQRPTSSSRFGGGASMCLSSSTRWAPTRPVWPMMPWPVPRHRMPTW